MKADSAFVKGAVRRSGKQMQLKIFQFQLVKVWYLLHRKSSRLTIICCSKSMRGISQPQR